MDDGSHDAAAASLNLLDLHFRHHPVTGPTERRSPSVSTAAPLNLDILDHIDRCVAEVVHHTRAETSQPAGPPPARVADIYNWYREHTADAGPEVRLRRDIVIHRQGLEHAIALGDHKVVRTHPCPACQTWGLQWDRYGKRVLCFNRRCRDRHGMARTWTLVSLATAHVIRQENRARRAT